MNKITSFLILFLPLTQAITIQGTVYDFSLLPTEAIIEINTTPHQVMVAKNGSYTFNVPPGSYLLKATDAQKNAHTTENIQALQEGKYTLDLILFPDLHEDLIPEENNDLNDIESYIPAQPLPTWPLWLLVPVLILLVIYALLRKPKETKKEVLSHELHTLLTFIEKQGGRTTQKEIRKQFNHSEAKISLMLDEMEAKGLIEKIKKGRGNIIVKK